MIAIEATHMIELYIANFLYAMVLVHLKWRSGSFRLHQVFPILMV